MYKMPTLYQLTENYIKFNEYANSLIESDDITEEDLQMLVDTLDSINDSIEYKVENIVKFMKNLEGDIAAYKAEEERLKNEDKYNKIHMID